MKKNGILSFDRWCMLVGGFLLGMLATVVAIGFKTAYTSNEQLPADVAQTKQTILSAPAQVQTAMHGVILSSLAGKSNSSKQPTSFYPAAPLGKDRAKVWALPVQQQPSRRRARRGDPPSEPRLRRGRDREVGNIETAATLAGAVALFALGFWLAPVATSIVLGLAVIFST